MSDPFIAEIIMFGGNFAPRGWSFCDGQLLPLSTHTSLFSLLGTTFGGDGRNTFALPDLRGRFPLHPGSGPGLSTYNLGQKGGVEKITQPPAHTHNFNVPCNPGTGSTDQPAGSFPAASNEDVYHHAATSAMGAGTTASTGTAGGVSVVPPFVAINFIIALQGLYPSRT